MRIRKRNFFLAIADCEEFFAAMWAKLKIIAHKSFATMTSVECQVESQVVEHFFAHGLVGSQQKINNQAENWQKNRDRHGENLKKQAFGAQKHVFSHPNGDGKMQ